MNWYFKVISNYFYFSGRARRKEFWMFTLFHILFASLALVIDVSLELSISRQIIYGPFYLLYIIITFIPSLAVTIRRLHDTGKSGWMYLLILVPIVGPIVIFIFLVTDGQPDSNKWGPNPKLNEYYPTN